MRSKSPGFRTLSDPAREAGGRFGRELDGRTVYDPYFPEEGANKRVDSNVCLKRVFEGKDRIKRPSLPMRGDRRCWEAGAGRYVFC